MNLLDALRADAIDLDSYSLRVRHMDTGEETDLPLPLRPPKRMADYLAEKGLAPGTYGLKVRHNSGKWPRGERKQIEEEFGKLDTMIAVRDAVAGRKPTAELSDKERLARDAWASARAVQGNVEEIENEAKRLDALSTLHEAEERLRQKTGESTRVDPLTMMMLEKMNGNASKSSDTEKLFLMLLEQARESERRMHELVLKVLLNNAGAGGGGGLKEAFDVVRSAFAMTTELGAGDAMPKGWLGEAGDLLRSIGTIRGGIPPGAQPALPGGPPEQPQPRPTPQVNGEQKSIEARARELAQARVRAFAEAVELEYLAGSDPQTVAAALDDQIGLLPPPIRKNFENGHFELAMLGEWCSDELLERLSQRFGEPGGRQWLGEFLGAFGPESDDDSEAQDYEESA